MKIGRPHKVFEIGQSLVELAVGVLVLIILVMGIIDLGRALFYYTALRDAAQAGATYGSIQPQDCAGLEGAVYSQMSGESSIKVTQKMNGVFCNDQQLSDACSGQEIEVTVEQDNFPLVTPILGIFIGNDHLKLVSTITGTIVRPPCP